MSRRAGDRLASRTACAQQLTLPWFDTPTDTRLDSHAAAPQADPPQASPRATPEARDDAWAGPADTAPSPVPAGTSMTQSPDPLHPVTATSPAAESLTATPSRAAPGPLSTPQTPPSAAVDPGLAAPGPRTRDDAAVVWRHPRANRSLRLDEHQVEYELRRGRRRTIGFSVGTEGLSVSAPRWVGQGDIEGALREKSRWILRKLAEQRQRQARVQASRIEWRDGASVPFLGETVILVLDPRTAGAVLHTDAQALPGVPRLTLHVGLPQTAQAAQIRDAVQSWLQRQARRVFEERCRLYEQRLGVQVRRLSLSSAQTRWGSASADGSIRLNWRLIHFGLPTIDYVVAHELAHLRVMDHSPQFWAVVRSVVPDYESIRGRLREDVVPALD